VSYIATRKQQKEFYFIIYITIKRQCSVY